jgi:hypothetical protein
MEVAAEDEGSLLVVYTNGKRKRLYPNAESIHDGIMSSL